MNRLYAYDVGETVIYEDERAELERWFALDAPPIVIDVASPREVGLRLVMASVLCAIASVLSLVVGVAQ